MIWGYVVCLCPIKETPGLNELIKLVKVCFMPTHHVTWLTIQSGIVSKVLYITRGITSRIIDSIHAGTVNSVFLFGPFQIEFQGSDRVYMAATLLDRPVRTSRYLFPQPAPASMLHDLEETYFFLNGFVNQPLTLKINSTVSTVSMIPLVKLIYYLIYHYENMPMQYTEIFKVVKMKIFNGNFFLYFSYFCSKT